MNRVIPSRPDLSNRIAQIPHDFGVIWVKGQSFDVGF